MADFLLFLGKLNLAMGAAIIVVYLLRRPLRTQFGAPIAYAIWLLVPIAVLASLLPPRVAALPPAPLAHLQNLAGQYPAAPMTVIGQIAHPALRITGQLTEQPVLVHPVIAARAAASVYGTPDYAMLLFAAWALGAVLMALYLARLQARFHATMRLGEAGPAVLGFFRPRVVMPDSFQEQFTAPEQAAILAHERVHLARQDARINALAALLRCLCWFNPLIHLGAAWLRIDQELACDATALAGPVSRRDYANALLKSQMMVTALPLGCNWPGSQHPLIERIALLKRKRPGTARRIAGMGLVMFAATCAGLGAWAAQPAVPGKAIVPPRNRIALADAPRIDTVLGQNTQKAAPAAEANPVPSGNVIDVPKIVPVIKPITAAPQTPITGGEQTQLALQMFQEPEQKIDLALNEAAEAALAKAAADASGSLSDETAAQQLAANGATPASAASPAATTPASPVSPAGMTADEVVTWLQSAGYTAHVVLRTGDAPLYTAQAVRRMGDAPLTITSYSSRDLMFGIYPRDCKEDHCRHLHFFGNLGLMNPHTRGVLTDKQIAQWNQENPSTPVTREKRMPGKAGSPTALSFDEDLPGATHAQINGALALWNDAVNRYYDFSESGTLAAPTVAAVQVAAATPASAGSGSGNAPRPKTESALRCLLGMEPEGCESIFAKAQQIAARRQMKHCAVEYTHQMTGCPRNLGPLESVTYLGTGQDLADVYDVDYLSEHTTYCILPPAPDGKMSGFLIFGNSHGGIFGPCAVISSPADPPQILYTRPQDHAALQSTNPDGAFIPEGFLDQHGRD